MSESSEGFASRYRSMFLHRLLRRRFHLFLRGAIGDRYHRVEPGPAGPDEIVVRTAVLREQEIAQRSNPDYYFYSAYAHLLHWLSALERRGPVLQGVGDVLELGCGSARLIRHLRCIGGANLVASDVDRNSVEWCRTHLPGVEFHLNRREPPLDYASTDSFDLILAASVFTHIPIKLQASWIRELFRILRPGGILLVDVAGAPIIGEVLDDSQRALLVRDRSVEIGPEDPRASVSTRMAGSMDLYQPRSAVEAAFGAVFKIADYVPGRLDLLVLRKDL